MKEILRKPNVGFNLSPVDAFLLELALLDIKQERRAVSGILFPEEVERDRERAIFRARALLSELHPDYFPNQAEDLEARFMSPPFPVAHTVAEYEAGQVRRRRGRPAKQQESEPEQPADVVPPDELPETETFPETEIEAAPV